MTETPKPKPDENGDEWKLDLVGHIRRTIKLPKNLEDAMNRALAKGVEPGPDDGDTLGSNNLNNFFPPDVT